jgi:serine/threonine protein kinase/tetratricopeptide (TPR) repeat protein
MVGTQIAHYRMLRRIGAGGMGEVYLAQDLRLDRQVAVKILPAADLVDERARKRLLREALAAASLDHPFICKIFDAGEDGGQPFIAMEYVDGTTLKDRIARDRLPLKAAIRLACEIAEALDAAHRRGIVHRDLKPANVMVAADGHVKVMDFGVAARVSLPDHAGTVSALTLRGETTGTLAYMSPEQLRGEQVDARSDVFAFGVLLYEMLTGTHPFLRPTQPATAAAILNDTPSPLNRYLDDPPPLLDHILTRLLAKSADDRHPSLRETQLELGAVLDPSTSHQLTPPASGRRRTALAAAAAVVILAGAAFVSWRGLDVIGLSEPALAFKARDWILIADVENLTQDPVFDRSLRVALEVGIAQSKYVNVLPRDRLAGVLRRMQAKPDERITETLAADIAQREGNVRGVLAGSITQLGSVYSITARLVDPYSGTAVVTESVQAQGKDRVLEALDDLSVRMRRKLGESWDQLGASRVPLPKATTPSLDALQAYSEGVRSRENQRTSDELLRQAVALDPDFAMAHAELGRRYYLMPDSATRKAGEVHLAKALGLLDRLSVREQLWIQASAEDARGNRESAVDRFTSYLAQYPDDARAWFRLGWTYMAGLQRYEKAIDAFNRVATLTPRDGSAYVNLATCHAGLKQEQKAVELYAKAFELVPAFRTDMVINHEYGFTLVDLGRMEEAERVFAEMKSAPEPAKQARGARSAGLLEMLRGRYSRAENELRQSILLNRSSGAALSEYRDRLILARALHARGDAAAVAVELAAVDRLIARQTLGPEWLQGALTLKARRGDVAGARRLLATMVKNAGDSTAGSGMARNVALDTAHVDRARGEIELAERHPERALPLFESAHLRLKRPESLDSLAAGYLAAGRLDEAAARYEELLKDPRLGNEAQELWLAAHVSLARLRERQNRSADARVLYERLIAFWKDAEPGLPLLKEARAAVVRLAE